MRRHLRRATPLAILLAVGLTAGPAVTAGPALAAVAVGVSAAAAPGLPAARAAATPGTGAPTPCSTVVTYTVNGKTPAPRPMPAPASRVGGELLARPDLQVTPSATAPPPAPKASAWLVADLDTGQVLAACNVHAPLAPASSLKVLTALTLMGSIAPGTKYTARDEDARVDGTRVGLVPGSVYTVDDLWHALLMSSANDAAVALGQLGGGLPAATASMGRTARALGADDTVPRNTSGLDEQGQVSSAYDLALFGRAALKDPKITPLLQARTYAFPEAGTTPPGTKAAQGGKGAKPRATFQIQSHNHLLASYPGALGVKNGWTSTTGGSFIGAAGRDGRRVIATVLAADPETWQMSAALLDWAFTATPRAAQGVGRLVDGPTPPSPAATARPATAAAAAAVAPAATGGRSPGEIALAVGAAAVFVVLVTWLLTAIGGRGRTPQGRRTPHRP